MQPELGLLEESSSFRGISSTYSEVGSVAPKKRVKMESIDMSFECEGRLVKWVSEERMILSSLRKEGTFILRRSTRFYMKPKRRSRGRRL